MTSLVKDPSKVHCRREVDACLLACSGFLRAPINQIVNDKVCLLIAWCLCLALAWKDDDRQRLGWDVTLGHDGVLLMQLGEHWVSFRFALLPLCAFSSTSTCHPPGWSNARQVCWEGSQDAIIVPGVFNYRWEYLSMLLHWDVGLPITLFFHAAVKLMEIHHM